MIWKNPFLIRQAEKIDTVNNFLQMFSAESLSFISEQSFNTIKFIRSSPGAGKTTVFKAMQANVLAALDENVEYTRDFFDFAIKNKIIEKNEVKLLSCIVSCAKNYSIIDEIFVNGRRQHVLFALLNVRIIVLLLKNIMLIHDIQDLKKLELVTFVDIPEECLTILDELSDGYKLYVWASKEERKICKYLDNFTDEATDFSLSYTTLFLIRLFEPNNVKFNNQYFLNHTLIIFDDVQKLTSHQRELLVTTLFTMRPNLGIWIGERLEALSNLEIITSDATLGREYEEIILEDYWKNKGKSNYKKTLSNIADRRVMLKYDELSSFSACLEEKNDYTKYIQPLENIVSVVSEKINSDAEFGEKYKNLLEIFQSQYKNLYEKALHYIVLEIYYNRDVSNGQITIFTEPLSLLKYDEFYKKNLNVAIYYLSYKAKLPYYFGIEVLQDVSSYNIEQFLAFSGAIFEQYVAKKIVKGKTNGVLKINSSDQQKYIKQVALQRYSEISRKFKYGDKIQNLLNNISKKAIDSRNKGTCSYSGGAYTGIGIPMTSLELLNTQENVILEQVISDCIASNYFDKRPIVQGGQQWMVLYYNRWLCVYYDLPLAYGGWFRSTVSELEQFLLS